MIFSCEMQLWEAVSIRGSGFSKKLKIKVNSRTFFPQDPIALYPDHDIELTFDVEMTVGDICDVNTLRLLIYQALDGDVESETLKKSFSEITKSQVRWVN